MARMQWDPLGELLQRSLVDWDPASKCYTLHALFYLMCRWSIHLYKLQVTSYSCYKLQVQVKSDKLPVTSYSYNLEVIS